MAELFTVTERLCKTEDGERIVPENHPEARWLYAIPGQQVPMDEAERFGLVDADAPVVPDAPPADETANDADAKEQPKAADKARGKGRTK